MQTWHAGKPTQCMGWLICQTPPSQLMDAQLECGLCCAVLSLLHETSHFEYQKKFGEWGYKGPPKIPTFY